MTESDGPLDRAAKLLEQALALPQQDRAAFLDRACEGDAALRAMLDDMLRDAAEHSAFLTDPPPRTDAHPSPVTNPAPAPDSTAVTRVSTPLTEGPGSRIGRYKLLQQIGEGGFGVVFMAEQERPLRRRVALKIIKLGMDTRQVIARFEAERQALAMMDHPNIAKVLDAGATNAVAPSPSEGEGRGEGVAGAREGRGEGAIPAGRPYFVMELVRGIPITQYCDANNLAAVERLNLFVPVCQAIQHAHTKGVIHRDIKPSNILVTLHDGKPVPKVIDFGIAKATDHRLTEKTLFTEHCQMIGTPAYMSPEQAEMSGLDIDTRTDVYSLGVLLYELLTGTTPFAAADLLKAGYGGMQRMIREVEPPRPSTRVSTLGDSLPSTAAHRRTEPKRLGLLLRGDLDWITMKALEKDRTRRYETTEAFAADVRRHLAGEPVVAAPPSAGYRMRKFVRKHRGQVVAASLIAVSLLIGFTATTVLTVMYKNAAIREHKALDNSEWSEYVTNIGAAQFAMANRSWNEARARLDACPKHKRGWEWNFLWQRAHAVSMELPPAKTAKYNKDGKFILTVADGTARVEDTATGKQIRLEGYKANSASLSPDGTRVLVSRVRSAEFGDERRIYIWGGDGQPMVWLVDVRTDKFVGKPLGAPMSHGNTIYSAVFSSDGSRILTASGDKTARVWDLECNQLVEMKHGESVYSAEFSLDGAHVLTATEITAQLWDAVTGKQAGEPIKPNTLLTAAVLSSDSRRVLTVSGNTAQLWDATTGTQVGEPMKHQTYVTSAVFSSDSKRVLTTSENMARMWNAATGAKVGEPMEHHAEVNSAVFSPDGTLVLTASGRGNALMWDSAGRRLYEFDGYSIAPEYSEYSDSACVMVAHFSPDGRHVLISGSNLEDISEKAPILILNADRMDSSERQLDETDLEIATLLEEKWNDRDSGRGNGSSNVVATAYTFDGSRKVIALRDRTIRFHETSNERETAVIKLNDDPAGLRFTSDGTRLIVRFADGRAVIWDTREPSTRLAERQARFAERPMVEVYVDQLWDSDIPIDRLNRTIRDDKQLSRIRKLAAGDIVHERTTLLDEQAKETILKLKENWFTASRVQTAIKTCDFAPRLRTRVTQLATEWRPTSSEINKLVWPIIKLPNPSSEQITLAVEAMEEARQLAPNNGDSLNTLGVAQYRAGQYADALASLTRADQLNGARSPADASFIAMAHFRLGHSHDARVWLEKLRVMMRLPHNAGNAESLHFLRETEELIEGRASTATSGPATTSQPASLHPSPPDAAEQPTSAPGSE